MMAVLRKGPIRPVLVTLEMATHPSCPFYPAAKLLSPLMHIGQRPALWTEVPRCGMAAGARARSEEEKKSRKAAREEITAAHKQFPFLPTKPTRHVYILDTGLADEIASAVIKNQSDPSTPILEANPGPGVVTKALLEAGAKQLVLAEPAKGFMSYLQELKEECGAGIVAAYHLDYLSPWRRVGDPDCGSTQFEANLPTLFPHRHWSQGAPVSVVGVLGEQRERPFLTHLINTLGRQHGLFSQGRPEWFLVLSPALYTKLLAVKMEKRPTAFYSHLAIVLHLLFDIRFCAQLPGWKFTPRFPEKRVLVVRRNKPQVCNSMRYLLRLRPHVSQPLTPAQVPEFYTFLAQVMQKKNLRLIPKMEQLVPGSGPHLIRLEVTMMTLVADLSPHQFLAVFKAMQTWPEYQGSPLKQLLASSAVTTKEDSMEVGHRDSGHRSARRHEPSDAGQKDR